MAPAVQKWEEISLPGSMMINGHVTVQFRINAKIIRRIMETVADVWKEIVLVAHETGLHIRAMDESQVAMADLHLNTDMLKDFICEDKTELPISVVDLVKVLAFLDAGKEATDLWFHYTRDSNALHVRRNFPTCAWFDMNLLAERKNIGPAIDAKDQKDFAWKVWIDAPHCNRIMEYLKDYGDSVHMNVEDDAITFKVRGDGIGATVQVKARESNTAGCKIDNAHEVTPAQHFSLEYLRRFTKACVVSKTLELRCHDAVPFTLKFFLDDDTDTGSYLACSIAPKVDLD